MGNFKPLTKRINSQTHPKARRTILRGSVGANADNLPSDLRLVSRALSDAGLLSAGASHKDVKTAITNTLQHIQRTMRHHDGIHQSDIKISPADDSERAMRRAIAEFRYPTAHRAVALSTAPKGARALVDCGISIARRKLYQETGKDVKPTFFQRAALPALSPNSHQSNRLIVKVHIESEIAELDSLIAESLRKNGKDGFVEVRDFFSVLFAKAPEKASTLEEKVNRRLDHKSRRRFNKLIRGITPNEGDFDSEIS